MASPKLPRLLVALLALASLAPPTRAGQNCQPPAPPAPSAAGQNIFSEEQEVDLGDAIAEQIQRDFKLIDDAALTAHLRRVGERVTRHLPPTKLRFQFFLVDLPDANAFVLPGGRIYVSRKLIAFARSEDELAGVMAHEIGHLVARQGSLEMTKLMKEVLGVTAVGDRRDVFAKYNQLVENVARKPKAFDRNDRHEDKDQIVADQIGLFALAAAGYDPNAFVTFFDRLAETKGKKGNFFSDLFGVTSPDSKRLREMTARVAALPAACKEARAAATDETFKAWQATILNYTGLGRKESLHAVKSKTPLDPPLRGDVTHLRFSPDGKYVVAQDDAGINVLSREPFTFLFRIEAPEANKAFFSPDSADVIFYNDGLRVETWSVAEQKLKEAHEIVTRKKCLQSGLSPDGRTLACLDDDLTLGLFEVATSAQFYQKKSFYSPNPFEMLLVSLVRMLDDDETNDREFDFINLGFSPDSRYFAAGQRGLTVNDVVGFVATNSAAVVDLTTRKEVSLKQNAKKLLAGGFAFTAPDRLVGLNREDSRKSGVIALPAGDVVEEFALPSFGKLDAVARGNYVLMRPVQGYAVAVFDLAKKEFFKAGRNAAMDVHDQVTVAERLTGELGLYPTHKNEVVAHVGLPLSTLGRLRAVALSPDFKYLAISERSRGAVWDLSKGSRIHFVRGFRGGHIGEDAALYADFPKLGDQERNIARLALTRNEASAGPEVKESGARQQGPFVVHTQPAKKGGGYSEDTVMDVFDARTMTKLWSKPFPKERPRYWFDAANETVVFSWPVSSKAAQAEIKSDPALKQKLAAMKEKEGDYLLQVLNARTGQGLGRLLIETGKGSFRITNVFAAGDWVVAADNQNRVLVYSLASGEQKGKTFGARATVSRAGGLLAVENESGRLAVYDLATMEKRDEFGFTHPVALARFSADGKSLFALTTNQTAYVLDVSAAGRAGK
jgi:beta-barrel assembly-enhancing protease